MTGNEDTVLHMLGGFQMLIVAVVLVVTAWVISKIIAFVRAVIETVTEFYRDVADFISPFTHLVQHAWHGIRLTLHSDFPQHFARPPLRPEEVRNHERQQQILREMEDGTPTPDPSPRKQRRTRRTTAFKSAVHTQGARCWACGRPKPCGCAGAK